MCQMEIHKPQAATTGKGRNDCNDSAEEKTRVQNLIVGFGFAAIPLLRLLEERGEEYTIISSGKTIWQRLKEADKLHFNLVSSFHASYYSQDQLAQRNLGDYFPTATEFYEYQERIFESFRDKVIEDKVTRVDNYNDHSLVFTSSGTVYDAKNVIFATGLGRPQNQSILHLDWDTMKGKRVAFTTFGDTANMMLSKLVPNGNACVLIHNGFIALDKDLSFNAPGPEGSDIWVPVAGFRLGRKYRIDLAQGEVHTIGNYFPKLWGRIMSLAVGPPGGNTMLGRQLMPESFFVKFQETYRRPRINRIFRGQGQRGAAGWANGDVGIKYHPIDMYKTRYAENLETLEANVRAGHLLNDFVFFHDQGLVKSWVKNQTTVDRENKTISRRNCDGSIETMTYDYIVDGGDESPNLPPIFSVGVEDKLPITRHRYQYKYRESFLGVVPSRLNNVFFLGFTRPLSGGSANLNEMQAMMIHRLITDSTVKRDLKDTLYHRIDKYNHKYYPDDDIYDTQPRDHIVFYGLYTREVAKFMGMERPIISTCFTSWNPWKVIHNLRFEFMTPNNAFKYRISGEYAVKGLEQYAHDVYKNYDEFAILLRFHGSILLESILVLQCLAMLSMKCAGFLASNLMIATDRSEEGDIFSMFQVGLVCVAAVAPGVAWLYHIIFEHAGAINLVSYSLPFIPFMGIKSHVNPLVMIYIAMYGEWYWCLYLFAAWSVVAYAFRQVFLDGYQGRYIFSDCKFKYKYRGFWQDYQKIFSKIELEKVAKKKVV